MMEEAESESYGKEMMEEAESESYEHEIMEEAASESYEKRLKKQLKEREQDRMKMIKNQFLISARNAEQSVKSLEKEKAELEVVLDRIRRHQEPIMHIIGDSKAPIRSIDSFNESVKTAEMRSTIEAVEKILSVFDSSLLQDHPKNRKEFKDHPPIEKRVLQFAAKAHFTRTSYDIEPQSSITRSASI